MGLDVFCNDRFNGTRSHSAHNTVDETPYFGADSKQNMNLFAGIPGPEDDKIVSSSPK